MLEHGNRYRTSESECNRLLEWFIGVAAFVFTFYGAFLMGLLFALPLAGVFWIALNALQLAGVPFEQSSNVAAILFLGLGFPYLIWIFIRIWGPMYFVLLRNTCFLLCAYRFSFADAWALFRVVFSDTISDWVRLAKVFK